MITPPSSEDKAAQLESILNAYGQSLENPPPAQDTVKSQLTEGEFILTPAQAQAVPQPKVKKRLKLEPEENSRLSMLMSQLPEMEVQKREAAEKLEAHKKAIQQEIAAFVVAQSLEMPDVFDLPADPYGAHPAYTLSAREGAWRIDTEALKSQEPETYVKWAKKGNPYWELKRVQKNRVHRG